MEKLKLDKVVTMLNVAEHLNDETLSNIGNKVIAGYNTDLDSRLEWVTKVEKALDLAKLQKEEKSYPFQGAANIKYPLITTASIQFAARTYPEVVRNGKVVGSAVLGSDPTGEKEKRSLRVSKFMSGQLLVLDSSWEEHTDKLLHMLPVVGLVFKKTWFDAIQNKNRSEVFGYENVIVNDGIVSLEEARRITHLMSFHSNDLLERMRAGIYSDIPVEQLIGDPKSPNDEDLFHDVLEQHRWLDLDEDGYEEPYVVTVHLKTAKVLRIVARFDKEDVFTNSRGKVVKVLPIHYFTDYHFLHSADGKFHSVGFGVLLLDLNETVNTILNQLIDAGRLANLQGGFIGKGLRIKKGQFILQPGQWEMLDSASGVDIKSSIIPMDYKEPSSVLLQLLTMLIDTTKELASVTDALQGAEHAQNSSPTTVLAMIKQGLVVFSSIQRRLYRSFKKEFEKLYRLNRIFLSQEDYAGFLDDPEANVMQDFDRESLDIHPVSDPNVSSDSLRAAKAQAVVAMAGQPGLSAPEMFKYYFETLEISGFERFILPPNTEPTIEEQEALSQIEQGARKLELDEKRFALEKEKFLVDVERAKATIIAQKAQAIGSIAAAEAAEAGTQIATYKARIDGLASEAGGIGKEPPVPAPAAQEQLPQEEPINAQQTENLGMVPRSNDPNLVSSAGQAQGGNNGGYVGP